MLLWVRLLILRLVQLQLEGLSLLARCFELVASVQQCALEECQWLQQCLSIEACSLERQ